MAQTLYQDFRYGVRGLLKNRGFTLVATITLALGIGANSAIFSVINAVLLRPYPYEAPERLVVVWETQLQRGLPFMFASPPNYADWRTQNQVFDDLAAFEPRGFFLKQEDEPARVQGARVTASLFSVLKVAPQAGRLFREEDDLPGSEKVALLSHSMWRDRFGSDPAIVGSSIVLDYQPHTVVGVMPPEFKFPPPINLEGGGPDPRAELWVPFALDMKAGQRGAHYMRVIARLKQGVTRERAISEMSGIAKRLEQDHPSTNTGWDVTIVPLTDQVLGETRPALVALLAAVGFVLLIACVNVANLLLARGAARQKEFAIRAALGAGRLRLLRQVLTESLALALLGGAAGLALAGWGIDILISLAPQNVPRLEETSIDSSVIAFTLGVSILTGVLFGLAPALQSFRQDLTVWLKEGGRTSGQATGLFRLRGLLVIAEVALSLVLLVGAGLLLQSFARLRGVEAGFRSENVLTMRIALPKTGFATPEQKIVAFKELDRQINSLPEVEAAGFVYDIPLAADRQGTSIRIDGEPPPPPGQESQVNFTFVTPRYFDSMGVPLLKGRAFTEQDVRSGQDVIIVNAALARRFFGDEDPLGRHLFVGFNTQVARRIVGVVGDVRHNTLKDDPFPNVYVPYFQVPWSGSMSLMVRSSAQPATVLASVREQLRQVVPNLPVFDVKTMEQVLYESLAQARFSTLMMTIFSAVALLLAI
ncbi:MAG TPA: ABC transporter permease, partial [Blastocatellia bacterium]|nr:ABC transporter permease [Blastocatellia bacterium]